MQYNWNIQQMGRFTPDGFVVTVHHTVNAVDGAATTLEELKYLKV